MEYMDVVRDFIRRTRANLDFMESARKASPRPEVYEVTQLVNSLLGLLVFPQQRYVDSIPAVPLAELGKRGWPIPHIVGDYPQAADLRQLVRLLRNSIAHFNIEFKIDEHRQVRGLTLWNISPRDRKVTWKAELTVADIGVLARRFVSLLLQEETYAAV